MPTAREEVEAFLAAEKPHRLPVPGKWAEGNRPGEYRMRLPIEVLGELIGFELELIVAPDSEQPGLRIVLLYGRPFWRLCMTDSEHPNDLNRPSDLPAMIKGPHHHSWADNRHLGPSETLPRHLRNARALPANVQTNQDAFHWFLRNSNIEFPNWQMPDWPQRTKLL